MLAEKLKLHIRDVADFPKPGILFKDITPLLKDAQLCSDVADALYEQVKDMGIQAVAGVESRGFLFGLMLANRLNLPFIPIRKAGKLPYKTISQPYDLEYGTATIEMHEDAFEKGSKILVHDDLLATGGTVEAATKLIEKAGGTVCAYSFLVELGFLDGSERLEKYTKHIFSLIKY